MNDSLSCTLTLRKSYNMCMKYEERMIQHLRDNYPKEQAQFLIDEYKAELDIMTDGDFGGGGLGGDKHSYDWAEHNLRKRREDEMTDLLNTDDTPTGNLGFNL